jgi:hypothetical protein
MLLYLLKTNVNEYRQISKYSSDLIRNIDSCVWVNNRFYLSKWLFKNITLSLIDIHKLNFKLF